MMGRVALRFQGNGRSLARFRWKPTSCSRRNGWQEEKGQAKREGLLMAKLTKVKARKILSDKTVRGKKLTGKQRRFFGAVSSGKSRRR